MVVGHFACLSGRSYLAKSEWPAKHVARTIGECVLP